jgi:homopolymeric O-antigen transport system permease protein
MTTTSTTLNTLSSTTDPPPSVGVKPTVCITPPNRWQAIDFAEIWEFRDLLLALAVRDVKLRYKQTALGIAWVVLQPLIGAGIFTFVFGVLADLPSEGLPPFLVSFAGMFAWTAFSQSINKVSICMVGNAQMISKVYFPRLVLPLSQVASVLVDLAVSLGLVAVLLALYRINPGWQVLLLPVWVLAIFLLAVGVGNWAAALMVSYRDVRYVMPVMVQFLLYASPVGYALVAIQEKVPDWAVTLYMLNPLASLIEATRWSMLGTGQLHAGWLAYSLTLSLVAFVIGAYVFRSMERKFADVI